jgi:hypothetical protein
MKKHAWTILSAVVAGALPWAACSGNNGATTGTGGQVSGSHASSSGTGGALDCSPILMPTPCDDCVVTACCPQLYACNNDANCLDCFTHNIMDPTVCTLDPTKTVLAAIDDCTKASCTMACAPAPPSCNPVTNVGCMPGSACDFQGDMNNQTTFGCWMPPPPNTVPICGACDDKNTACAGGLTCLAGQCAKFCCDHDDCGPDAGECASTHLFGVGICVTTASVEAGAPAPACDAPAVSPSMGKCLMSGDGGAPPADAGEGGTPPADAGEGGTPPADAGGGG